MLISKQTKLIFTTSALLLGLTPHTWSEPNKTNFEFGVGLPYFQFDSDYGVEEELGLRGIAGFRKGRMQFELNYDTVSAPFESILGEELDLEQLYANALLFGNSFGNFEPFISGGWGQANFEADGLDVETTMATLGAGLKYYVGNNFTIRPAINYYIPTELDDDYAAASLTFSYLTGKPYTAVSTKKAKVTPPGDADNDGIADLADQCPATPSGVLVNANGCAKDSDNDGVADYNDNCKDTGSNLEVDKTGCPISIKKTVQIDLKVNFDTNSSVVKPQYYGEIKQVADFMAKYKDTKVLIEGHTDTSGAAAYNKALSQKRADAVAQVLVSEMKVAASRVGAIGYGEERPLNVERTTLDFQSNRRVIAKISATVETLQTK